jgi:UDP-N-acetylglucosamine transferase subunit ALG13
VIFVTIGSMFPFDRLIRAMDAWAAARPETAGDMLAQIGEGEYRPAHMRWVTRLGIAEYEATVAQARLVVAHAGVGSVVTAGEHGRPIVVLPRRAHLGEHTSDHQMQTAGWLRGKPGVQVAETEADLADCIDRALAEDAAAAGRLARSADPVFIARLRDFLTT